MGGRSQAVRIRSAYVYSSGEAAKLTKKYRSCVCSVSSEDTHSFSVLCTLCTARLS